MNNSRTKTQDTEDKRNRKKAAKAYATDGWIGVYKLFPEWKEAIETALMERSKNSRLSPNYEPVPMTDELKLGRSLVSSIQNFAREYKKPVVEQLVLHSASNNGKHAKKPNQTETQESRATINLLRKYIQKFGCLPSDEGSMILLDKRSLDFIVAIRQQLQSEYDMVQVQDDTLANGFWLCKKKELPPKPQLDLNTEKLVDLFRSWLTDQVKSGKL